jgi:hypothetical protein
MPEISKPLSQKDQPSSIGKLLKSYVFWTYPRGSVHYDVMVTAILIFMFGAPRVYDFKDRPVETVALHSSEVLVKEAGVAGDNSRFLYQIRADDVGSATSDKALREAILRVIEPISGAVTLERYEPVKDGSGHVIAYNAWVLR